MMKAHIHKLKKLLAVALMVFTLISALSLPVSGSIQVSDVTEYSSGTEWIQNIDIEEWAEELDVATYSNVDEWTENTAVAEWAEETDILSYADDIVYAYKYEQTEEQIEVSGKIDSTVIVHADGTEEVIYDFPFVSNSPQTRATSITTYKAHLSVIGDGNGNLNVKCWHDSSIFLQGKITMTLYYGTCRVETPNNVKASTVFYYMTPINAANTLSANISTTKYFMVKCEGDGVNTVGSFKTNNLLFNKKANQYPEYTDSKSGIYAVPPYYTYLKAEVKDTWTTYKRDKYRQWYADTYYAGKVPWNWKDYNIHHIRPLQYGGLSDNGNLIPLTIEQHNKFTTWWKSYA